MPLEMTVHQLSGWTVLDVAGELDVYTAPRLRDRLIDLINDGSHRLVVGMDGVTMLDSTGLGVLIGALKRLRGAGGELRVVATGDPVLRIVRVTGLHRVLGPYSCVEDAVGGPVPLART